MTSNPSSKLLILADDLTGALDSGVQLTHKGRHVVINTDCHQTYAPDADVIVIDTETRHLPKEEAYRIVYALVKEACAAGITHIYKKTDSGLRGNVGAELSAVLDASHADHLHFIPAYPQMNRVTKDGIHYVNDTPLAESVFAQDPIDPVTTSRISDLIHQQSEVKVTNDAAEHPSGIIVHDADTEEDLQKIAEQLAKNDDFNLTAGCAGFLEKFPSVTQTSDQIEIPSLPRQLIVLSGSVNAITKMQLDYVEQLGAPRYHVPLDAVLAGSWDDVAKQKYLNDILSTNAKAEVIVIDTLAPCPNDYAARPQETAKSIDRNMGALAKITKSTCLDRTLMIIGGDTLHGMIHDLQITQLYPVTEVDPGVVLARYRCGNEDSYVITKSGGFGQKEQLANIAKWLSR